MKPYLLWKEALEEKIMADEAKKLTTRQRLELKRIQLQTELKEVETAIDFYDKHAGIDEYFNQLNKLNYTNFEVR